MGLRGGVLKRVGRGPTHPAEEGATSPPLHSSPRFSPSNTISAAGTEVRHVVDLGSAPAFLSASGSLAAGYRLSAATRDGRCVIEVSSYQLEATERFRPRVAVWLNLTPDHLDRYGSMAAYGAAKARIFLAQQRTDHAVVPADDPVVLAFARGGSAKVHTWGGPQSDVRIEGGCVVGPGGLRVPIAEIGLKGAHNVANAMADQGVRLRAGGRRRYKRRMILAPFGIAACLLTHRPLKAGLFWDWLGFADYAVGVRPDAAVD